MVAERRLSALHRIMNESVLHVALVTENVL
jgi:hypothetical protein